VDFFGIGILELGVILIVALLVLGPNQLPHFARKLGDVLGQARKTVAETRDILLFDLDEQQKDSKKSSAPDADADGPKPIDSRLPP